MLGGHEGVNISALCQFPEFLYDFYSVTFRSNSAFYFLKLTMLISLVGILSQIRMGAVCITFTGMGPRRGQYAFLMSKF